MVEGAFILPRRARDRLVALSLVMGTVTGVCAAEMQVGRSIMRTDSSVQLEVADLGPEVLPGDGHLKLVRKVARLASPGHSRPTYLLVQNVVTGGSRFEWSASCDQIKSSRHVFVHSPFHTNRNECVLVQGPFDLEAGMRQVDQEAYAVAKARQWELSGEAYLVMATLAIESGSLLSVTAYVPMPFAGLPPGADDTQAAAGSGIPPTAIAWGLALGREVRSSVLSLSGKWQLPFIKQQ